MIEVIRIIGDDKIPLFRIDGWELISVDGKDAEKMAKRYGLYGLDERLIRQRLWGNPYLNWREVNGEEGD